MSDLPVVGRAARLDRALAELLGQAPELEAAAIVSFDGLAMASALPAGMDEDRVAAMSAALLSLGEKAAHGLGRGDLSQVYVEGETGTVFLISCDDEAVLVAVAAAGAKAGLMLFEVRRAAAAIAEVLRVEHPVEEAAAEPEAVARAQAELAEAEAAYAAHKASQAEALAAASAAAEAQAAAEAAQREAALAFVPAALAAPPSPSPLLMPVTEPVAAPAVAPVPSAVPSAVLEDAASTEARIDSVIEDAGVPASWAPSYAVQTPSWS
jgi:predicted regulator of Ras-like GTPase activity (Roadblock/LC7/MglB family)